MITRGKSVRGGDRKVTFSRLNTHFKYIERRSRDLAHEQRDACRLFSKDQDTVLRKEAMDDIIEHTSTRISYHKILLSPAENESVWDWRQWTRDVMADLEEVQGKDLHWYAVHHQGTENSHVHVVVAGVGYDWETGEKEMVKLSRQDYAQLRTSGHNYSEYTWEHRVEELFRELERQDRRMEDGVTCEPEAERLNTFEQGEIERRNGQLVF